MIEENIAPAEDLKLATEFVSILVEMDLEIQRGKRYAHLIKKGDAHAA